MTPMIRPGILRECLEEVERKAAWGPPNPIGTFVCERFGMMLLR